MHSLILFPLILQLVLYSDYSVLILEAKCNTCARIGGKGWGISGGTQCSSMQTSPMYIIQIDC